jgi:putative tryptophan/tyrosine transport system substrate-binding protein
MNRRTFIGGLGSAATCSVCALAQQGERLRRIGVLMGYSETVPIYRSYLEAFSQELARSGWVIGGNVKSEQRWTGGDAERAERLAKELVGLQPDVILAASTPATAALHRETRAIPIVAIVSDPVGSGFAASLPRPGGNITGFINIENTMAGKQLDLPKEVAPFIRRAAIMFNPDTAANGGRYYLDSFEVAARSMAIETAILRVRSAAEIDMAITSLGRERAGLVVRPTPSWAFIRQQLLRQRLTTTFR